LLQKIYTPGAKELRKNHIEEINIEAFSEAQLLNEVYEAKGDKKIDGEEDIIKFLENVINTPDCDWVKGVLINLSTEKSDHVLRANFNLFKQFIVQLSVSNIDNLDKFQVILKNNLEFQEGAIDLINELAENTQKSVNLVHLQKSPSTQNPNYKKPELYIKVDKDTFEYTDEIIEKEIAEYSITPTTLKHRTLGTDLAWYIDKYTHENSAVMRFGINTNKVDSNYLIQDKIDTIEITKKEGTSSIKTSTYRDIKTQELIKNLFHSTVEKFLMSSAIDYLLDNKNTKVVLVDILERSVEIDKVTLENGVPRIHTVVLYKNPAIQNKHDIVVIDPSNFFFSSHLSNDDIHSNITHKNFNKIITKHEQIQIYVAPDKNNIGCLPNQWRDCIDVAVKLAFIIDIEANKKDKPLEFIDLNKITKDYEFVQMVSNTPNIDKSIKFPDISCRIKQASDVNKMKQFFNIEKVFDKNLQMLKEVSSKSNDQTLQKFKEPYMKLYSMYNSEYKNMLTLSTMDYDKTASQLLEINNNMTNELKNILNHEQQLLGDCNYEI
jgi:hypothetical protein